jgi:hypothetical protein
MERSHLRKLSPFPPENFFIFLISQISCGKPASPTVLPYKK